MNDRQIKAFVEAARLLGNISLNPPFSNGQSGAAVHTAMPLGDRPFAIVTTEGERTLYSR